MAKPMLAPALIGEFLGTALLVILGDGVVATIVLLNKQADWIVITTGWAIAVTLGVYTSNRLSGGHLNPAVTLALATRGEFPWSRLGPYWLAQVGGGFLGGCIVYWDYSAAFLDFERTHSIVRGSLIAGKLEGAAAGGAGVFATYPAFDGLIGNCFSEFLGTAILLFCVSGLTDRRNAGVPPWLQPVLIGGVVLAIGLSLGGLTGYAINPARDLGPRLASAAFGWGWSVFRSHQWYFWVPIAAPLAGGITGAFLYDRAVRMNLPNEPATADPA